MDYKILVVDDDEHTHVIIKSMLKPEGFELLHAKDSQQAIDILSEEAVNLILSDIHMPGITGLEFLESLMADADKKEIPVLIMTNLPTVEKEKKALNLGAADFIDKVRFVDDKEGVRKQVRMKLVSNVSVANLSDDLVSSKNELTTKVMGKAIQNDFSETASVLCEELVNRFGANYAALWTLSGDETECAASAGPDQPDSNYTGDLKQEKGFFAISEKRAPYLTNHIFNENFGFMPAFSEEKNLPAEIGVPLYCIDERALLMNNMKIPADADLFGVLFIKRNKLYSTPEYNLISKLVMQFGSILWRLYSKEKV